MVLLRRDKGGYIRGNDGHVSIPRQRIGPFPRNAFAFYSLSNKINQFSTRGLRILYLLAAVLSRRHEGGLCSQENGEQVSYGKILKLHIL